MAFTSSLTGLRNESFTGESAPNASLLHVREFGGIVVTMVEIYMSCIFELDILS